MSDNVMIADNESRVRRCWPVFMQLRPHLADEEDFIARWRTQSGEGYHIAYLGDGGTVRAAAGYRFLHTMAWGHILYLDDLVTDANYRGTGLGGQLLSFLKETARVDGCDAVHLDTGYQRHAAHRAYLRSGFRFECHHLAHPITGS